MNINKYEKEVEQVLLNNEKLALKQLENTYVKALADIKGRLRLLQSREETQSTIYQINYQKSLEKQVNAIINVLQQDNIATIEDFLSHMYTDGYLSIQYSLMQQGIPVLTAISQEEVTKSLFRNIATMNFADRVGVNMKDFKQVVKDTISRGIATNSTYSQIAQQLSLETGESLSKSYRIARTEGHRVTSEAKLTSIKKAKQQGCDVVKQWDSTLDGKTRKNHRKLDGQWVEEDEYFEIGGHKAKAPGKFGRKEEDINCRCILLTRPRWAVEKETTRTKSAKITDEYGKEVEQLINVKNYDDYKKGYYDVLDNDPEIEKVIARANKRLASYEKIGKQETASKQDVQKKVNELLAKKKQLEQMKEQLEIKKDLATPIVTKPVITKTEEKKIINSVGTKQEEYNKIKDYYENHYEDKWSNLSMTEKQFYFNYESEGDSLYKKILQSKGIDTTDWKLSNEFKTKIDNYFKYDKDSADIITNKYNKILNDLSSDEKNIINKYTTGFYEEINDQLRDLTIHKNATKEIDLLTSILNKTELLEDTKLYRKVGLNGFEAFTNSKGLSSKTTDELRSLLVGTEHIEKAFTSTSTIDRGNADFGGVYMQIFAPKGTKGTYVNEISEYKNVEYEMLLQKDTKFKIIDVVKDEEEEVIKVIAEVVE